MAKATAICTCAECGTTFEKSTTKSNRREADNWESWAISNYTQCPQCWGKEQRQKEIETPLTLNVAINPYDTTTPIILSFSGNTIPQKDSIKALGYFWNEMPMTGFFGALSMSKPKKCWNKQITVEALENELKAVEALKPILNNKVTDIDLITYRQIKSDADKKESEKAEKLAQIEKPVCPEVLKGCTWNQTIYGKKGNYNFYSNNQKISITDSQKEEIEKYLIAKAEYKKLVAEIEKGL